MPKLLLTCGLVGFIAMGHMAPVAAQTSAPTSVWQIKLPAGSHDTALHGAARLFGFPVQMRLFTTPLAVPQLIRFFSTQLRVLRDLHVLNGAALLSGQANERSWVVHLQGMAYGGTRGTLSLLESAGSSSRVSPVRPPWIPYQARLLLDLHSTEGAWLVTEQIWSHWHAPNAMRAILQSALLRVGWQRSGTAFGGGTWQLDGQDLVYSVVTLDKGSAVFSRVRQRA